MFICFYFFTCSWQVQFFLFRVTGIDERAGAKRWEPILIAREYTNSNMRLVALHSIRSKFVRGCFTGKDVSAMGTARAGVILSDVFGFLQVLRMHACKPSSIIDNTSMYDALPNVPLTWRLTWTAYSNAAMTVLKDAQKSYQISSVDALTEEVVEARWKSLFIYYTPPSVWFLRADQSCICFFASLL